MKRLDRILIPQSDDGKRVLIIVGVSFIVAYAIRVGLFLLTRNIRGNFGLFALCFLPLIVVVASYILAHTVTLLWLSVSHARHATPFIATLVGLLALFLLPLPPLPPPKPFPEQVHFAQHRSEYEYVVQVAHDDALQKPLQPPYPENTPFRELPQGLEDLTRKGVINVSHSDEGYLIVEFEPFDFYYRIVYIESPDIINETTACYYDGSVTRKIDDYWYLCEIEWN